MLAWIFKPIYEHWASPGFQAQLAGPAAFAAAYMAHEATPEGGVTVRSRAERWTLFHQVKAGLPDFRFLTLRIASLHYLSLFPGLYRSVRMLDSQYCAR